MSFTIVKISKNTIGPIEHQRVISTTGRAKEYLKKPDFMAQYNASYPLFSDDGKGMPFSFSPDNKATMGLVEWEKLQKEESSISTSINSAWKQAILNTEEKSTAPPNVHLQPGSSKTKGLVTTKSLVTDTAKTLSNIPANTKKAVKDARKAISNVIKKTLPNLKKTSSQIITGLRTVAYIVILLLVVYMLLQARALLGK